MDSNTQPNDFRNVIDELDKPVVAELRARLKANNVSIGKRDYG